MRRNAKTRADIERLWDVCQIPDYRKTSPAAHADLVMAVYGFIVRAGRIPDDWFARQIASVDRTDGDIDALSARISQVRTCAFIANRNDWLNDPEHWQGVARQVEDSLSDALHARLTQRFVDRRASVLMRRLRENTMLEAEVTPTGQVMVEGHHVGSLQGFCFTPDPQAEGEEARTLNAAAQKALATEIEARARRVHEAVDEAFVLANDGIIRWLGEPVGRIAAGDHILKARVRLIADEHLTGAQLEMAQNRLDLWLAQHVKKMLGSLEELEIGDGLEGVARGIAFQIGESLGVLERSRVAEEMKTLPQDARAALRKFGVRFGAYHLYLPALLKPAPRALAAQLWALKHGGMETVKGIDEVAHLASSGRTSFAADATVNRGLYRAAGFRVCGDRAVRVDILERLADLIRPAIAYRPGVTAGDPPPGAADGEGFVVTVAMTSLAGCSGESFASILKSLGYASETRTGPAITVPLLPKASTEPVKPVTEPAAESRRRAEAAKRARPERRKRLFPNRSKRRLRPSRPKRLRTFPNRRTRRSPRKPPRAAREVEPEAEPAAEAEPVAKRSRRGSASRPSRRAGRRRSRSRRHGSRRRAGPGGRSRARRARHDRNLASAAPSRPPPRAWPRPARQDQQPRRHGGPRRPHGAPARPAGETPAEGSSSKPQKARRSARAATTAGPRAGNRVSKASAKAPAASKASSTARGETTSGATTSAAATARRIRRSARRAKSRPIPIRPSPSSPRSRPSWKPGTRRADRVG